MKDQLEKFVAENRADFDREVPNLKVWANIEKELNPPPKRWTMWWNMGIAASVMFLLGIGAIIGMNLNNAKTDASIAVLGEQSEEYLEMQQFYQSQVKQKVAQLSNYSLDQTVEEDMAQIDDFLEELKEELNNAVKGSEDQIINAMINNYQTKLAILERVLQRIKSTQQDSNKKKKMTRSIFNKLSILLLILTITIGGLQAATTIVSKKKDFSKVISKEFNTTADGQFTVKNKYGEINIKTWDNNKVKIDVTITVKAGSEDTAEEVFNRINIDFSNGSNYVRAETNIQDKKKSGWSSWWNSSKSYEYTIDYEVYMPRTNDLDLYNKYGHSYVEPLMGEAKVAVKYGDIRMEEIGKDLTLTLGYGNGTIIKANNADVVLSYSKIKFKSAGDMDLETKYSKIYIDEAMELKCASKYDTYEIGRIKSFRNQGKYDNIEIVDVETIDVLAKYSDFEIHTIEKKADFDMQYGGMAVETLGPDFSEVELLGKYTEFRINVTPGTNFKLDAVTQYAGIRYPSAMKVVYEKEKGSSHEVEGYMGGDESTAKLIKARLSYGGIKVRY